MKLFLFGILCLLGFLRFSEGHGYLSQPASRNAAWKCGFNTPANYDLSGLSAGGPAVVRGSGLGNGVCGDPINGVQNHLEGGTFSTQTIVAQYAPGSDIEIKVVLTAFHYGHFRFFLCPIGRTDPNWSGKTTQQCLQEYPLERADGRGKIYDVTPGGNGVYTMQFKLPANLECERCVLQWYYQTANSGCSSATEEFWNCADIKIKSGLSGGPTAVAPSGCHVGAAQSTPNSAPCWDCPMTYNGVSNPNPCKSSPTLPPSGTSITPTGSTPAPTLAPSSTPPPVVIGSYSGSYVASPVSRSDQASSQTGSLTAPCDATYDAGKIRGTVQRAQTITLKWPRNDFSGGIVRIAWVSTSSSSSATEFNNNAQIYSCFERTCRSSSQCRGSITGCTACDLSVQVPGHLADGTYTLQWVWYGGGSTSALKPFHSCVDYTVSGGPAVTQKKSWTFLPGDATFAKSCFICPTCTQSYGGGPTLSQLVASLPTTAPTTAPTSGPTSAPTNPCPNGDGIFCTGPCSSEFYQCSAGYRYGNQPVAPGTKCNNNQMVLEGQCTTPTSPGTPAPTTVPPTIAPPLPTSNNGQTTIRTCSKEGTNCLPGNCCPKYFQCTGGIRSADMATPTGALCYEGSMVLSTSPSCAGQVCQDQTPNPVLFCGDGLCDTGSRGETCLTCPSDCGVCPTTPVARCGDAVCNGAETCATCRADCGVCQITPTTTPAPSSTIPPAISGNKKIIGYYTNWAQYRTTAGGIYRFLPENIDAGLYTHLCYAFAKVSTTYEMEKVEWNDLPDTWDGGMYKRFHTKVRTANKNIKTLISIGGWNFNSNPSTNKIFSNMVASQSNRQKFIQSAIKWCRDYDFDGVDVDWEYPGVADQGGVPADKANFVTFLREFRTAINAEAVPTNKAKLLLSIAVGVSPSTVAAAYDIANIHPSVDWIGLMTYDIEGSWNPVTGSHTPLYGATVSIDSVIANWRQFCPADKLILGLGTYGRTWTLSNPSSNGMGAPAKGAGVAQAYTGEPGFASYYEIKSSGLTSVYDSKTKTMYGYKNDFWVSYDNENTLSEKVDYLYQKNLAGVMIWAIDLDDFTNGNPLTTSVAQRIFAKVSNSLQITFSSSQSVQTLATTVEQVGNLPAGSVRILGTGDVSNGGTTVVYFTIVETYSSPKPANELATSFQQTACQNSNVETAGTNDCKSSGALVVSSNLLFVLFSTFLYLAYAF